MLRAPAQATIAYEGALGGPDSEAHRASWVGTRLGGTLREVAAPMSLAVIKVRRSRRAGANSNDAKC